MSNPNLKLRLSGIDIFGLANNAIYVSLVQSVFAEAIHIFRL